MKHARKRESPVEPPEQGQPRFGSYIGLFYVVAIVGILSFTVWHDVHPGHVFDRLDLGMTPTEVAAILGAPRTESKSPARTVQTWHTPDGFIFEVEFRDGELASKERRRNERPSP